MSTNTHTNNKQFYYLRTQLTKITLRSNKSDAKTFCRILVLSMQCRSFKPVSSYLLSWCKAKMSSLGGSSRSLSSDGELADRFKLVANGVLLLSTETSC